MILVRYFDTIAANILNFLNFDKLFLKYSQSYRKDTEPLYHSFIYLLVSPFVFLMIYCVFNNITFKIFLKEHI